MDSKKTDRSGDIFQCTQCGSCCSGYGGTYITGEDIRKISEYIKVPADEFIQRFCTVSGSRYLLAQGKGGKCIFFNESEQCTIHPVKPYMCRAWPFINAVILHPENWDAMADQCPGMKQGVDHETISRVAAAEKKKLDTAYGNLSLSASGERRTGQGRGLQDQFEGIT
ncbi:MAG: YkgJ family cysteine cluster protein [Desulfobacteraceae bacterium]